MKKNKIAKFVLALGIGAATAFSGVAAVGCNPDNNDDDNQHQEQPKNKYTVTFNLNGAPGTAPASKEVESGSKVDKPTVRWEGHTLEGWFDAATGGNEWKFDTDTVTSNITLYAHWKLNEPEHQNPVAEIIDNEGDMILFGEGDKGLIVELKANIAVTVDIPDGAVGKQYYLAVVPSDAFANEGMSDAVFTVKIGEEDVEYSVMGNWGLPFINSDGPTSDPLDFTGITSITLTSASDVTVHIALIDPAAFGQDGPENPDDTEYEDVRLSVDFAKLVEENPAALTGDYTFGKMQLKDMAGSKFETSSGIPCLKFTEGGIYFTLSGIENSITLQARSGSSNKSATVTLYKITDDENGEQTEEIITWGGYGQGAWFCDDITKADAPQADLIKDLEAGTYKITRTNTVRINKFETYEKVAKGTPESLEVTAINTDLLLNRAFSTNGVSAMVSYTNGAMRAITLTEENFDTSAVDMSKAGTYQVKVTYTESGKTVEATYDVNVFAVTELNLGTFTTNGTSQTNFKQVYKVNGTFSTDGLTVVATAKCGEKEKEFVLAETEYSYNTFDLTATGAQIFTVTAANSVTGGEVVTRQLTVNVVNAATVENNMLSISVNKDLPVSSTNFKTITDALVYIEQLNLSADVVKVINIADGTYNEKVFVNIPNVQLIGSADKAPNHTQDNGVIIVYDAIAGKTDAAGHAYGTNGSGTVTIGSKAIDFVAKNITFKNYYNTNELYELSRTIHSNTQAVALTVESGKAAFFGCKLTSYHDTLYSNKGNHYYEKCWIEGHTDYIFGQDARAYFNDCDIYSIGAVRKANGDLNENGGYVTALKPSSASADYYFVYNNCRFDADENTMDGSVALGRAWGADMKMVVMNSTISVKFSTAAHTAGTDKAQRYCTMSGNEPKPANMLEYNNTGAGAVNSSIDNTCTVIDSATASKYDVSNLSVILGWNPAAEYYTITVHYDDKTFTFSAEGGKTITNEQILAALGAEYSSYNISGVYTDAAKSAAYDFAPVQDTVELYIELVAGDLTITEDVIFNFNTKTENSYTAAVGKGETKYYGKLEISGGESGSFAPNGEVGSADWYTLKGDASLTIKVPAGTLITVLSYDEELAVTGADETHTGAKGAISYSLTATAEQVVITKAEGKNQLYVKTISVAPYIKYEKSETIDLSNCPAVYEGAAGRYKGIEIDATGGKFNGRPANGDVQLNAGTKLTIYVNEGATVSLTQYNGAEWSNPETLFEIGVYTDGAITITVKSQIYIKAITVNYSVNSATHTLNLDNVTSSFTEETLINDIFYGLSGVKKESSKISGASYGDLTFTHHISLTGGKATTSANAIKFTVDKACVVTIYAAQKSDKTTNLVILNAEGKAVTVGNLKINDVDATAFDTLPTTAVNKYEFTLEAGTYLLGGAGGGAYVFGLSVEA